MRRAPGALSSEAPAGAPPDVGPRPVTSGPPPRSASPGAAAAGLRTLDPVFRATLKAGGGAAWAGGPVVCSEVGAALECVARTGG
jgi:hypothetical protein